MEIKVQSDKYRLFKEDIVRDHEGNIDEEHNDNKISYKYIILQQIYA